MKSVHLMSAALLSLALAGTVGCSSGDSTSGAGTDRTNTGGTTGSTTEAEGTSARNTSAGSLGRVTNFDRGAWYSGDSMYNANNGYRSVENETVLQETQQVLDRAGNAVRNTVNGR